MSRPDAVTKLAADVTLRTISLSWKPLPWSTMVDHYRVHGVPGSGDVDPSDDNLIAKTVYPELVHGGLDPAGEAWTYRVVTVDAAGRRSDPSARVAGKSTASVTATGTPIAVAGDFDAKTLEFQFAPSSYSSIPKTYPDAVIDVQHGADVASRWPYLLPGPGDAWAGNEAYVLNWTVPLDEVPSNPVIAIWLVDTTRLAGRLDVEVNGSFTEQRTLIAGGTRGSRDGDATAPGSALVPSYHEFSLPADALTVGDNLIRFTLAEGGWVAWDAIGIFETS